MKDWDKWEYLEKTWSRDYDGESFTGWLTKIGENGWEFVQYSDPMSFAVPDYKTCIFKRKVYKEGRDCDYNFEEYMIPNDFVDDFIDRCNKDENINKRFELYKKEKGDFETKLIYRIKKDLKWDL